MCMLALLGIEGHRLKVAVLIVLCFAAMC